VKPSSARGRHRFSRIPATAAPAPGAACEGRCAWKAREPGPV
jgi:hypothetical protein